MYFSCVEEKSTNFTHLEPCGDPLVHLEKLFGAVDSAVVLAARDFPRGKVPDTVVEADL